MTVAELNEQFGLEGVLLFEEEAGLRRVRVRTAAATATVYLHGAHVTAWEPTGFGPVVFCSERSEFAPGKAIRGGIPICFPWFGPRGDGLAGPSHGFARVQEWELGFAALVGEDVHLTFTLGPTAMSRELGFDEFRVVYEVRVGRALGLRLTVANMGKSPMRFEEALHTYFVVGDVERTGISGLEKARYLDKTDGMREKTGPAGEMRLREWTDRVYVGASGAVELRDGERKISVGKTGSKTTVVWNPWAEASEKIADLGAEEWHEFVCVETANTGADAVVIGPGEVHGMEAEITVVRV